MIRRGIGVQSYVSAGIPFDADAQAFITAAAITDATQQSAINTLVTDLKGFGIWTKMRAIYPMVGGTASTHRFNLKDPRDLDAAFRLVFAGGGTHSSTGYTPNGINGYGDTFFIPSTSGLSVNSNAISFYSGSNLSETSSDPTNIGAFNSLTEALLLLKNNTAINSRINGNTVSFATSEMRGFFIGSKTSSTQTSIFLNSTKVNTGNSGGNLPNLKLFIGTINNVNTPYAQGYVRNDFRFATIGDGLTDTEATNLYTAVQKYQTTLGRQVGVPIVADSDAQAFLNAAEITNVTQANAVDKLVTDLKGFGIWSKMRAIYPFVGGTASSHRFNLKDPRDLDAAFRSVWSGGITHSANGVQFGGVNGYGDTFLLQNSLSADSTHLSLYSRTSSIRATFDIGGNGGSPNFFGQQLALFYTGIGAISHLNSYPTESAVSSSFTDTRAFYIASRISSTSNKLYRNSSLLATNTATRTSTLSAVNFRLANDLTPNYSNREFAFASIGDGLTDTEAANLYTAVQAYQTSLNRQV